MRVCGPYRTTRGVLLYGGCNVGLLRNLLCPYRTFSEVIRMRWCVDPYRVDERMRSLQDRTLVYLALL